LKIFIDTNILINIFTFRDNGKSFELIDKLEKVGYKIYLNDISIINIKYILRKSNQELVQKFLYSISYILFAPIKILYKNH
jgi:predicted nucleic acid-binding protein